MDFKKYLTTDVIPFWLDHAIDEECGGIFNDLDEDGTVYGTRKQVWFQGRALYILCRTYRELKKDPRYLEAAKKIFAFLPKCGTPDGRLFFLATRDGKEIMTAPDFFSETFAAIGCTEYYLVTQDEEAKRLAEKYFSVVYSMYQETSATPCNIKSPYRAMAPSMILLSTARELCKLNFAKYDKIAREAAKEILRHRSDRGMLENIGEDGNFVDTPEGREVNPGHSLECAWFLMTEALIEKDDTMLKEALATVDGAMEIGYRNGGIIAFADYRDLPCAQLEWDMKIWWPQCEAILANRMAYLLSGDGKYQKSYEDLLAFVFAHYADPVHGEWYGYLHYDNTVSNRLKGNISKGLFHMPRMLIMLAEMADLTPETACEGILSFSV